MENFASHLITNFFEPVRKNNEFRWQRTKKSTFCRWGTEKSQISLTRHGKIGNFADEAEKNCKFHQPATEKSQIQLLYHRKRTNFVDHIREIVHFCWSGRKTVISFVDDAWKIFKFWSSAPKESPVLSV